MQNEMMKAGESVAVGIGKSDGLNDGLAPTGVFSVECYDADGNLKWTDTFKNLVVTAGKNDMLDKYFTGSAYTGTFYMGLVSGATTPTYAAGDTMASHTGWTELVAGTAYSTTGSNRITMGWNAASSGSKASTTTVFNMTATNTVAGALVTTTQSANTGVLYSAGSFTGGSKSVASGDTLNVTYTATLT